MCFIKINTGRVALFLKHKQNYNDTCTVKSCNILEVKKALVKPVYHVMEYTVCSHILPVYITWKGWSDCCFYCQSNRRCGSIHTILRWNSLNRWCFSVNCRLCLGCQYGECCLVTSCGITFVLVINALAYFTLRFPYDRSRLQETNKK
jgi:hypothetical protein